MAVMYRVSGDLSIWLLVRSNVAGKAREKLFPMLCKRNVEPMKEKAGSVHERGTAISLGVSRGRTHDVRHLVAIHTLDCTWKEGARGMKATHDVSPGQGSGGVHDERRVWRFWKQEREG